MRNKEFVIPLAVSVAAAVILSTTALCFKRNAGIICLILSVIIIGLFAFFTRRRYKKLEELNDYLSAVIRGDYSFNISDNSEGELSILSNNLLKVISEMKTMNEKLQNEKVFLADSLADISHQLKTPLTAMCVSTDILKNTDVDENQLRFIEIIENECDRMRWLINTLLKLSKIDAGTAEFTFTDESTAELIENSTEPFLLTLDLKNITLKKNITDSTVYCDKNWLTEAVRNIIKNAIEHTPDGGKLTISASATTLYTEIAISDTGCGISDEDLPHIFERFYRSGGSSKESVGIGLALSKEIVSKHRGKIEVHTTKGEGTTFTIRIYKVLAV